VTGLFCGLVAFGQGRWAGGRTLGLGPWGGLWILARWVAIWLAGARSAAYHPSVDSCGVWWGGVVRAFGGAAMASDVG
jgi:hypothetical protein